MGVQVDRKAPFYFTKSPGACVASGARVAFPPATENYHYSTPSFDPVVGTMD